MMSKNSTNLGHHLIAIFLLQGLNSFFIYICMYVHTPMDSSTVFFCCFFANELFFLGSVNLE
jgi:hypothetical protein